MALSPPPGFSTSFKTPVIAFGITFGASSACAGTAPRRICVLANKLAAGTAPLEQPVQVFSPDLARTLFGAGSEAFAACRAVYAQYRSPNLWVCPVAEGASAVAATCTFLLAGPATASGVAAITVGTTRCEVPVGSTDTAATIAANLAAKINTVTDLPVTASVSTATVTLTAKQKGPRGNAQRVYGDTNATGVTLALNGGTAAMSVSGNNGGATAGSIADSVANALAAIAALKFDYLAPAHTDATNLGLVVAQVNAMASISTRLRQRVVAATVVSEATAKTLALALNQPRVTLAWHFNADQSSAEIAACFAAERLWGDTNANGVVAGEQSYAACNHDGAQLVAITPQRNSSDLPLPTMIEDALNNGLCPLAPSSANPGMVQVVRSTTTRFQDAAGNPNYSVIDSSKVVVSDFVADGLEIGVFNEFRAKNLAPDPGNGLGPTNNNVIFPSTVQAFIGKLLKEWEAQGLLINVDANMPALALQAASDNPTMLLGSIPENVIPHFHSLAGQIQQQG